MLEFKEDVGLKDGLFIMKGNVKIYEGDRLVLDKDNAITDRFRRILMAKLYNDIISNTDNASLSTVSSVANPGDTEIEQAEYNSYIQKIKFGSGSSASLGAKASRLDVSLTSPIPDTRSTGGTLFINTDISSELNISFNYESLKMIFTAELANNDEISYVLGELGLFNSVGTMLTHLFFDPIFFEPNTTRKIVYTISLY